MELPQLFGSDYVLPAIIAVVLLLAILGLLMLRRKQKGGTAGKQGRTSVAAAPPPAPGAVPGAMPSMPGAMPGGKLSGAELKAAKAEAKAQAKAAADQAKAAKAAKKAAKKAGMDVTQSADFFGEAAAGEAADLFTAPPPPPYAPAPEWMAGDAAPQEAATGAAPTPAPIAPPAPAAAAAAPAAVAGAAAVSRYTPGSREGTSFANDPLQTVLNSIIMGWGDISAEDTNRLEVFKPGRVLAAISSMELPKDLKSSEYARTRLNQLKRYAAYLEHDEKPPAPAPAPDDFVAINITPRAASQIQSGFESPAGATVAGTAAAGAAVAGAAAVASGGAVQAAEPEPVVEAAQPEPAAQSRRPSWYGPVDDVDIAEIEIVPLEMVEPPLFAEPPALTEPPLFAEPESLAVAPAETEPADFSWDTALPTAAAAAYEEAVEETGWTAEEAPAEAPAEAPQAPMSTEDAIAAAAAAFWAAPEAEALEQAAEDQAAPAFDEPPFFEAGPPAVQEPPFFAEPPAVFAAAADSEPPAPAEPTPAAGPAAGTGWISTADELLALPGDEQARMLGHLDPPELSKVFRAVGDSTMKKAVIDTLERAGSTASLDIIRECLEDPDPLIQLYALDAADRLLGAGN